MDTTATNEQRAIADELIAKLRPKYEKEHELPAFEHEKEIYKSLLPKLINRLSPVYEIKHPLAVGSTATVWEVTDLKLKQPRALKVTRPTLGKLDSIVRIVRAERERLAAINHPNVIKVFAADELRVPIKGEQYWLPFYVMEFLKGIKDLDKYFIENHAALSIGDVVRIFRDLLAGIAFLHSNGIIHCDIKPANLLVADGQPLVADLGYAKHLHRKRINPKRGRITEFIFTEGYEHPDITKAIVEKKEKNATIATIPRNKLDPKFDLFSFGRTMQQVLNELQLAETRDEVKEFGRNSMMARNPYQWSYLSFISKRLLDGRVVRRDEQNDIRNDVIPNLSPSVMEELKYESAENAIQDLEKMLHLFDLEGRVPELNPNSNHYIQVPHCRAPRTPRVQRIISHPVFARLTQVTQLGFVSMVYPGATHTRFEHVLGTFSNCCDYIRALWHDEANCLFQCVMSEQDLQVALLASLLHDIAQYPMAHDLTEVASDFQHEKFTRSALYRVLPGSAASLADIIDTVWKVDPERVLRVLFAKVDSPFRDRILKSMIDSTIDADKLDYLRRDSTHLGVNFGLSIDQDRFLRNLTIVYGTDPHHPEKLETAEIGVSEKALAVAHGIARARKEMFTQVYWQHTTRALKAMLGFVVRTILIRIESDKQTKSDFRRRFETFIFTLSADQEASGGKQTFSGSETLPSVEQDEFPDILHSMFEEEDEDFPTSSYLSPTDDNLLKFLACYAGPAQMTMIQNIRDRRLYKRVAVLSGARRDGSAEEREIYESLYNRFRVYRLQRELKEIERHRDRLQKAIIEKLSVLLRVNPKLKPRDRSVASVLSSLKRAEPLVLVDVPIKAVSESALHSIKSIKFLPEDLLGRGHIGSSTFPGFRAETVDIEETAFDIQVGKIRVLAHPDFKELLSACIDRDAWFEMISAALK